MKEPGFKGASDPVGRGNEFLPTSFYNSFRKNGPTFEEEGGSFFPKTWGAAHLLRAKKNLREKGLFF